MDGASPSERWRSLPRPMRWMLVVFAAVIVLAGALSAVVSLAANRWIRPLVEEEASAAIPGEVRIGSLGLSLLGLSVDVEGLEVLASGADTAPLLEVERLYVSIAHLPLLARRIVLRRIEIEGPVVRVVREASGEIDLLRAVVPETPAAETPGETTPLADQLPVRIRRLDVGAGRIEFTDREKPEAGTLTIEIPRSRADDVIVIGAPGERRSSLQLEVSTEGASIELDASFRRDGDVLDLDATAEIERLPLARGRVYMPDLGWSELAGELDAKLHYVHVTGKTQKADGSAEIRELRIGVPTLGEPALAFESLEVNVDELDLLGRRLALGEVTLTKPRVFFDPAHRTSLPLLPKGLPGASSSPTEPAPSATEASPSATEASPSPTEPAPSAPAPEAPAASEAPAFAWSLGGLAIEDAQLVPIGEGAVPLGLDVSVAAIASDAPAATAVELTVEQAGGSLSIEGSVCASPPGFRGKIALDALPLAPLLRVAAPDAAALVRGGVANGEIEVRLGSLAAGDVPAPGGDLHASGVVELGNLEASADAAGSLVATLGALKLTLQSVDLPGVLTRPAGDAAADTAGRLRLAGILRIDDVAARGDAAEALVAGVKSAELRFDPLELSGLVAPAGADAPKDAGRLHASGALSVAGVAAKSGPQGEFGFDLEKLEIGLSQMDIPGVLPGEATGGDAEPIRIALARARIASPKLRLTRTESGLVLPKPAPHREGAHAERAAEPARAKAAERPTSASPSQEAGAARAVRVELGSLALEGGSVRFVDRTVKPFYQGDVTGIVLTANDLAFPDPRVRDASLRLEAPGPAPLWALGAHTPGSSWFELNLDHLPLAPLNPYVRNASGYIVNGGELSLYSKGSVTEGHLYAANWVTLFDPDVSGGGPDAPLEKALGVPVSLAISLLADPAGNIGLSIPIDYDEEGASVRLGSVIGSAVKGVLIGALTSPLKLLGAVVDASGRVKDVTPEPIHFLPGRAELAAGDEERVAALAKLAATRPGLTLRLSGQTSGTDAQFLREALLLGALDSGEGLPEPARGLTQALVRRRLRGALEARLAGKPEGLDPEDAKRLEEWLAAVPVGNGALTDLARRRAARVQELLQTQFGLDAKQIELADPGAPGTSAEAVVTVSL